MPKYIDADAEIKKAREDYAREYGWDEQNALACVIDWLEQAPAAPVRREVHAAWRDGKCTNCGCYGFPTEDGGNDRYPFCHLCGATMDLDAKGE